MTTTCVFVVLVLMAAIWICMLTSIAFKSVNVWARCKCARKESMQVTALIINGVARTGKDTLVDILGKQPNTHVVSISSIDAVKAIAMRCGWSGKTKTDKDRKFLSDLKMLLTHYNDLPFTATTDYLESEVFYAAIRKKTENVFFTVFSREPEDIERYREYFTKQMRTKTVLVRRESAERNTPNNSADQNVFKYDYDIELQNNGTIKEFEQQIITTFLGEEI